MVESSESNTVDKPGERIQDTLHTVTFYSFKGGVGRTLALLNVAVFLARHGNRVAIADFDLEAPGIDSYPGFVPPEGDPPGVLEYLSAYTSPENRLVAPSCKDYLYCVFDNDLHRHKDGPAPKRNNLFNECDNNGALYVMRAGRQKREYRKALASLNWDKLFREQDGHLLFANLKNELFDDYGCNFLLIDSRTGLNDVAGVTTAFLPDAVVLMFYPDEQNERGIKTVAGAVRDYAAEQGRNIARMYCAGRVPQALKKDAPRRVLELHTIIETSAMSTEQLAEIKQLSDDRAQELRKNEVLSVRRDQFERKPCWQWNAYADAVYSYGEWSAADQVRHACVAEIVREFSPELRHDYFGGPSVCVVPEHPAPVKALPVLEYERGSEDYRAYETLGSFASIFNTFERVQLQWTIERCVECNDADPRSWRQGRVRKDIDAPFRNLYERQLRYACTWHPDIERRRGPAGPAGVEY